MSDIFGNYRHSTELQVRNHSSGIFFVLIPGGENGAVKRSM